MVLLVLAIGECLYAGRGNPWTNMSEREYTNAFGGSCSMQAHGPAGTSTVSSSGAASAHYTVDRSYSRQTASGPAVLHSKRHDKFEPLVSKAAPLFEFRRM